ncbi:MAG: hypothetical protein IT168_30205 [Bryobacterales bacterium]|nr:hypothetical protein [Bryobacterales bacterium]
MRRRTLVGSLIGAAVGLAQPRGGGWELRFQRVWERLEVRLEGPRGPLIRGDHPQCGGSTWCAAAGQGSVSLDRWLGDSRTVRLYARVAASRGPALCNMEAWYRGRLISRFSFNNEEYREISA